MKSKSLYLAAAIATVTIITNQAQAACGYAPPQAMSNVTENSDGTYHYSIMASGGFGYCGGNPAQSPTGYMSNFYLPYFDDMGISGLSVSQTYGPTDLKWTYEIQPTNNIFGLGGGALSFYATSIPDTLSYDTIQIDFNAAFGEVKGPFFEVITNLSTGDVHNFLGDPGIPGSPKTIAALEAANGQPSGNVPEPATLSLFALGATALISRRRKKA